PRFAVALGPPSAVRGPLRPRVASGLLGPYGPPPRAFRVPDRRRGGGDGARRAVRAAHVGGVRGPGATAPAGTVLSAADPVGPLESALGVPAGAARVPRRGRPLGVPGGPFRQPAPPSRSA